MASISSIISFIVILLAAYAYSAPILPDLQNATIIPEAENTTASHHKRAKDPVGSSSSSEEESTQQTELSTQNMEYTSVPSSSQTNMKREVDNDVNESFAETDDKRDVTEDPFSTETNTKRGIEVEFFQSSTIADQTTDPSTSQVSNHKRAFDGSQWLAADSNEQAKRAFDGSQWLAADSNEQAKRAFDGSQWLAGDSNEQARKRSVESIESSTGVGETSTVEDASIPSTSAVINHKRAFDGSQWLAADSNEQAKRAFDGSQWLADDSNEQAKRAFDGSQWLAADSNEQARKRSVESVELSTGVGETSTVEDASIPSTSAVINHKRAFDGSQWLAGDSNEQAKRAFDGSQWLAGDSNEQAKRAFDGSQWLAGDSDDQARKRSVEFVESSTGVGETSTVEDASIPSTSEVINHKRAFDGSQWLAADPSDRVQVAKRSLDNSQWLLSDSINAFKKRAFEPAEVSTGVVETSTAEDTSVPSTSEMINHKRDMSQPSSAFAEASEQFNKRAIGAMESAGEMASSKRENDQSASFSGESSAEFNQRAVGSVESVEAGESSTMIVIKIQSESTTDEQPSSSTVDPVETAKIIRDQSSSTSESETTVVPAGDLTSTSYVPSSSTPKILAIIPGKLSKPQIVIQPVTEAPVTVEHVILSQGQNQTITETKKPNY